MSKRKRHNVVRLEYATEFTVIADAKVVVIVCEVTDTELFTNAELTPAEARKLAAVIIAAAGRVERRRKS